MGSCLFFVVHSLMHLLESLASLHVWIVKRASCAFYSIGILHLSLQFLLNLLGLVAGDDLLQLLDYKCVLLPNEVQGQLSFDVVEVLA